MLTALELESAVFRGREEGVDSEEEEAFEEHQRRQRAAAKRRAAERQQKRKSAASAPAATSDMPAAEADRPRVRDQLECEHARRGEARERLIEREERIEGYLVGDHSAEIAQQEALSSDEVRAALASNQRARDEDAALFVQSYRQ